MIQERLKRPFEADEIEWRVQSGFVENGAVKWALVLAYVTNRAIMDRLDDVFGVAGWKNEFLPTPSMDGVMCGISAKFGDEWITKYDGASNTDIEAVKGGLSSAMKRTAVQFRIGRYLYKLESGFAKIVDKRCNGSINGSVKDQSGKKVYFNWLPPELPPFALPITKQQKQEISTLIKDTDTKLEDVLKAYDYFELNNVTKEIATKMILQLQKKKAKQNENNN